jgi:hypothetical protein
MNCWWFEELLVLLRAIYEKKEICLAADGLLSHREGTSADQCDSA